MEKKGRPARGYAGDDERELRMQRTEHLKELAKKGKSTRDFAVKEGLTAFKIKVKFDTVSVERDVMIKRLCEMYEIELIDPVADNKYEELQTASSVYTYGGRVGQGSTVTAEAYRVWVKQENAEQFVTDIGRVVGLDKWHFAGILVDVEEHDYVVEVVRDPLYGTQGSKVGWIYGLNWAAGLTNGDRIEAKCARLTMMIHEQALEQKITADKRMMVQVKWLSQGGGLQNEYCLIVADECPGLIKGLREKFDWVKLGQKVDAQQPKRVKLYETVGEYQVASDKIEMDKKKWVNDRSDAEVEDRTVVIFGSNKKADDIDTSELEERTLEIFKTLKIEETTSAKAHAWETMKGHTAVRITVASPDHRRYLIGSTDGLRRLLGDRISAIPSRVMSAVARRPERTTTGGRRSGMAKEQEEETEKEIENEVQKRLKNELEKITKKLMDEVTKKLEAQAEANKRTLDEQVSWVKTTYEKTMEEKMAKYKANLEKTLQEEKDKEKKKAEGEIEQAKKEAAAAQKAMAEMQAKMKKMQDDHEKEKAAANAGTDDKPSEEERKRKRSETLEVLAHGALEALSESTEGEAMDPTVKQLAVEKIKEAMTKKVESKGMMMDGDDI